MLRDGLAARAGSTHSTLILSHKLRKHGNVGILESWLWGELTMNGMCIIPVLRALPHGGGHGHRSVHRHVRHLARRLVLHLLHVAAHRVQLEEALRECVRWIAISLFEILQYELIPSKPPNLKAWLFNLHANEVFFKRC